jgi:phosphoribosylanthranilate isomerase
MFRIKICGITSVEDALIAGEAGADAIGLNFYSQSPRYVTAEQAESIVQELREVYSADQLAVYGVFVNASVDDILWVIREANLYATDNGLGIQLHGDEPPELLRELRSHGLGTSGELLQASGHIPTVPITRAFRSKDPSLAEVAGYLDKCQQLGALPQAVLLDGYTPGVYGGTGTAANWPVLAQQRNLLRKLPAVLAGGLTAQNIAEAIKVAQPDAVDVASGVESAPGKKDYAKTMAFVAAARRAFAELGAS